MPLKSSFSEACKGRGKVSLGLGAISLGVALPTASYLYAGLRTTPPSKIVKIRLSDFSRISALDINSDTGYDYAFVTAVLGASYLYSGFYGYPNKVGKIDLATFSLVGDLLTLNPEEDELYPDKPVIVVGDYLYVATSGGAGKLVKVDTTTMTRVGALNYSPGELYGIATDGTHLYCIDYTTFPGTIYKVRISDFSQIATLTLAPGEEYTRSVAVDGAGAYLYTGHFLSPGKIAKVDLSTFTRTAGLTLGGGENNIRPSFITGGYLYVGLGTSPGKVVKIDLSTFTEVSTLTFAAGENNVVALTGYGNYLYAGLYTFIAKIVKIDLTTFTKVSTLTLAADEPYTYSLVCV